MIHNMTKLAEEMCQTLLSLIIIAIILPNNLDCYNIEVNKVGVFRGDAGSQFGYTVAIVRAPGWVNGSDFYPKVLLAGAPNTTYNGIRGYGQVYGCSRLTESEGDCEILNITEESNMCARLSRYSSSHCEEDSRLGATMKVYRKNSSVVTVCAPGWKNVFPETRPSQYQNYMIGLCLQLRDYVPPVNCWTKGRNRCWPFWASRDTTSYMGRPAFTYAQGGISVAYTKDGTEVISGPGADDWRGAFSIPAKDLVRRRDWDGEKHSLYFGYAVATGIFEKGNTESIVAGIPNWYSPYHGHLGKVELYHGTSKWAAIQYGIALQCRGQLRLDLENIDRAQTGTKFGATLETVDLNGDGMDELLIGAPLYTGERPDEGRVFIYSSQTASGSAVCGPIGILSGAATVASLKEGTANARFGTSIADAGDLDLDGYKDVAIGAPYENNGVGAIYIYLGNVDAGHVIKDLFSQRIAGKDFDFGIKSFGWSLYGNEDVDDNSFPDLAVGAYGSDTAVVLRSRPIVKITMEAAVFPSPIPYIGNSLSCSLDNISLCFELTTVVQFGANGTRKGYLDEINIALHLHLDAEYVKAMGYSRVIFRGTDVSETLSENITLRNTASGIFTMKYIFDVKGYKDSHEPKDVFTPIIIDSSYDILPVSGDGVTTVQPILHKDSTRINTEVKFDNKCDTTDGCISDLDLGVEMFILDKDGQATLVQEGTVLYVGAANELEIIVDVRNILHTSYNAALTGTITSMTSHHRDAENSDNIATCKYDYSTNRHTDLTCEANRKLGMGASIRIKLYFNVTERLLVPDLNIGKMQNSLSISLYTSQANRDSNAYNNVFESQINVKLKYDLLLEVDESSKKIKYRPNDKVDQRVTLFHRFYITNQGPSFLPMTYVNIYIPVSKGERVIAEVKNVSEDCSITAGRPNKMGISNDRNNLTSVSYDDWIADGGKGKRISCLDYECLVVECKVTKLEAVHRKSIEITIDLLWSELDIQKDASAVTYTTSASVTDPVIWYGFKVDPFKEPLFIEKTTEIVAPATPRTQILKNEPLQDGTKSRKAVQLAPQHVKLNLKPVDVLRKSYTSDIQVGFGSFVDKPVQPFSITTPQHLENPCIWMRTKCDPTYGYIHRLHLSKDVQKFMDVMNKTRVSANFDPLEGGLDAIVQASVCPNIIGWRNQSRRILVYVSDSGFHFAGDGKLAGIDEPNDGLCHLAPNAQSTEEYIYTHSKVLDYPSFGLVKKVLTENKISSLFLVPESDKEVYKGLTDFIGDQSSTAELTGDNMRLYRFIESLARRLYIIAEDLPEGLDVKAETSCNKHVASTFNLKEESVKCSQLELGQEVDIRVTITLNGCPKNGKRKNIRLVPSGVQESVLIETEYACDSD
ncbi:integrin alpha-5-like isoform X2 [Mercenaria mercenaria]|uniref:integrin alpha-5-like isoform X2 n=1 Tax=Mercenaria mercenaria TaxID=6596 RepID=UPI00234F1232|nr:integrin alpha-5-like isoform X2 [Mercenaria mercenaria]